ncbi:MAG: NADP-specific glutamate dehydrogenase [Bryobacterales bacterium]
MVEMSEKARAEFNRFMNGLVRRNGGQSEFHQAVREAAEYLVPFVLDRPGYQRGQILERLTEPDRIVIFRVCWTDDAGNIRTNRGWRVQFSNAIGPYKGGLRFHRTVDLSVLKFLGFEQTLKNSLTTLPMGGAKGGSNFNPKGKSDAEVMRFCQSFMTELYKYIGDDIDIPAGDIGVGTREIGYLFGQYKRLSNRFGGSITGKGPSFGGSLIRSEATGYGCVYFAREMMKGASQGLPGSTCLVSGSGNVAQFAVEKAIQLGAKVVTISDSDGFIYDPSGIDEEKLAYVMELKNVKRGRIREYAEKYGCEFHADKTPWGIKADVAFPCATQNEINGDDAKEMVKNGVRVVAEGANMPTDPDGVEVFLNARILFAPGKAANAGGVAVSGFERSQNQTFLPWSRAEVDQKLQEVMHRIHQQCVKYGDEGGFVNYVRGANLAGFVKVADSITALGVV